MDDAKWSVVSPGMFDDIDLKSLIDPTIPEGYVRIDGVLVKFPVEELQEALEHERLRWESDSDRWYAMEVFRMKQRAPA